MSYHEQLLENLARNRQALVFADPLQDDLLEEVLNEGLRSKSNALLAEAYYWKGWMCFKRGNFEDSKDFYDKALICAERTGNITRKASIYNNRALLYSAQGIQIEAISELFLSLELHSKSNNVAKIVGVLANIASQYTDIGLYEKGEEYFFKAIELNQSLDEKSRLDLNLDGNLTHVYLGMKDFEKASYYAKKALEFAENSENASYLGFCYISYSMVLAELSQYEEALELCLKAEDLCKQHDLGQFYYAILAQKASLFYLLNRYKEAKELILENIDSMKSHESLRMSYDILYKLYKQEKNYELALKYYQLFVEKIQESDSALSKNHLASLENRYQTELKEKEQEILRLSKIELEQKAIRAQLNPHFIFNSLNSVQKYLLSNDKKNAALYLKNLSSLFRSTLENSESNFISLEEEISYLNNYLNVELMRSNQSFTFKLSFPEDLDLEEIQIPTMLLQPFVENSVKHGIANGADGYITIDFSMQDEDTLKCIIVDNGPGFQENDKSSEHQSMGMKMIRDRIRLLNEQYKVEYQFSILSLKQVNSNSRGTQVEVIVPLLPFQEN